MCTSTWVEENDQQSQNLTSNRHIPASINKSDQHRANLLRKAGLTLALQCRPNVDMSISPTSAMSGWHWGDVGPTFSQHWGDVGPTIGWCWANVFCQQCVNLLVNFSQPYANLLPTFGCWYSHIKHNFWGLKDVKKMSYFKACFGTCLEAWHLHDILKTSG